MTSENPDRGRELERRVDTHGMWLAVLITAVALLTYALLSKGILTMKDLAGSA